MTTVFTADAVTFDFVPEKYALKQDLIAAEFSLHIGCDWQKVIDDLFYNEDPAYALFIPATANEALVTAQTPSWLQTATDVVSGAPLLLTDAVAKEVAQKFVYGIATSCGSGSGGVYSSYYAGDAPHSDNTKTLPVSSQITTCLTSVLQITNQTGLTPQTMNALDLDAAKILSDMSLDVSSWSDVPSGTDSTAKLSKLLNANAFVPVLNRLIAGGGFSTGVIGEPYLPTGQTPRHFDKGSTADGSSDFIEDAAQLVFPVVIKFADDDSQLIAETNNNTTQDVKDMTGANVVSFQLNIIFEKMS